MSLVVAVFSCSFRLNVRVGSVDSFGPHNPSCGFTTHGIAARIAMVTSMEWNPLRAKPRH